MRTLILLCIFPVFVYAQTTLSSSESNMESLEENAHIEVQTRSFIQNYIRDINDPDWPNKIGPYLRNLEFIDQHKLFRNAFQNFHFEIIHLTVHGREGMIWGVVTANHTKEINDSDFKKIPATNKKVEWEEVWYYTVEDGKRFGEEFKLMHDDVQRMKAFDIRCLPD